MKIMVYTPEPRPCSTDGCDGDYYALDMCRAHYNAAYRSSPEARKKDRERKRERRRDPALLEKERCADRDRYWADPDKYRKRKRDEYQAKKRGNGDER